ncbi:MAG: type II toxin-antitoxin system HicA family toxin [Oscillospiraceae bacterium]|nr:type II toxin-antitoxin system HicA family toxin [Oscillospiraceae bacterium]MDY3219695.1 type II toxin-antitoxin system HicA family toxin [Candidatus Fimivivens sp.]
MSTASTILIFLKAAPKHFKHPTKPGKVTIPQHGGDLDRKTADSILMQAGLK